MKPACEVYFGDCLAVLPELMPRLAGRAKLVYLDPPYNTKRARGARRHFGDSAADWQGKVAPALKLAWDLLADDGFLAVSINQMELFTLKTLADEVFTPQRFVGLFPVKIRHVARQLMINATFHDVFEYLLIYRRSRNTRFHTLHKAPRLEKFKYAIRILDGQPAVHTIRGKRVEVFQPGQYAIDQTAPGEHGLRRYVIAGKIATANWSGTWYESHLRALGPDLLVRVWGLEKGGLGYRWFQTGNHRRRSGVYFQSMATAGRPILPCNDIDYTEVVPTIYREGGPGCDFKDSKKPEALLQLLMAICTRPGDLVLDFFAGSGTTLAAGIKNGRRVIAVENAPTAAEIIRTRLENLRSGRDLDGIRYEFDAEIPPRKKGCGRP